jgi:uncharacterized protein YjiS (DUF1127 family)
MVAGREPQGSTEATPKAPSFNLFKRTAAPSAVSATDGACLNAGYRPAQPLERTMSLIMNCEAATQLTSVSVAKPSFLARLIAAIAREVRIRRDMRTLSSFDDAMLHDIGLGRSGLEEAIRHGRWNQDLTASDVPADLTGTTVRPLSLTEWR